MPAKRHSRRQRSETRLRIEELERKLARYDAYLDEIEHLGGGRYAFKLYTVLGGYLGEGAPKDILRTAREDWEFAENARCPFCHGRVDIRAQGGSSDERCSCGAAFSSVPENLVREVDFSRISTPVLTDLVYDFERYCREVRDFFFVDLKALFGEEPREAPAFEGPQVPELGARFRLPVFDTELHGEPVLASCSFCAFGSEVNTGTSWYETTRVCTFPYHSESPEAEALVEASFQWHRNPLWRAAFWELEGRALSLDPLGELAARAGEGLESSPVCPRFELNPLYRDDPDVKVAREVEAEVVPNYVRIEAERRAAAVRQARELLTPPASKIERNQPDWQERALERLRQARAALPEELHVALEDPQLLFDTLNVSHGVARFMAEAARKARVS